jgi:hypothetical protein
MSAAITRPAFDTVQCNMANVSSSGSLLSESLEMLSALAVRLRSDSDFQPGQSILRRFP